MKNKSVYKCTSAAIPYSLAKIILGRKLVRELCGLRLFSDISYN